MASIDITNIITVTGDDPLGNDITDTDPSSVDVIDPSIDIRKNAEGVDSQQVLVGDTVTFTIYVENTGDVDLVNVVVCDPLAAGLRHDHRQPGSGCEHELHLHGDSCSGLHQHNHRDGR